MRYDDDENYNARATSERPAEPPPFPGEQRAGGERYKDDGQFMRDDRPYRRAEAWPSPYERDMRAFNPHYGAAHGFAQMFGMHPMMAFVTIGVDMMLHAADVVSAGLLIPFSMMAGIALGIIVFLTQRSWYGDDNQSAVIKAMIVWLLTTIPSPLPYVLFLPAGIIGFFRRRG